MAHLADFVPDVDVLLALEVDELALQLLKRLTSWPRDEGLDLPRFLSATLHGYPEERRTQISDAVQEAWAWLEGHALIIWDMRQSHGPFRRLSSSALRLAEQADPRQFIGGRKVPKTTLHSSIREEVWSLFNRGRYDTAVFKAMKAVEVAVRVATALPPSLLGVKLMRVAFAPAKSEKGEQGGPLAKIDDEGGEQVARMELFAGAIGSYKNPQPDRHVVLDDPDEAAEIIMLANHLLRIVDARDQANHVQEVLTDKGNEVAF